MGRKKKPRQDTAPQAPSARANAAQRAFLEEMLILSRRGRSATVRQKQDAAEAAQDWEEMIGRLEAWSRALSKSN